MWYENGESRDHWQTHVNTPHFAAHAAATQSAVAELSLNEMTNIG
jgi:quinol monooxygenase YgiN